MTRRTTRRTTHRTARRETHRGAPARSGTAPALCSEWTKARTLRSTWWLLLALAAATTAAGAAVLASVDTGACAAPSVCDEDTTRLSLGGARLGQVFAVLLAASVMGAEYGAAGTLPLTLAATPRRHTVLFAKATVLSGLVLLAGTAGVLGSLAAGRLLLPGNGFTAANGYPALSLADAATLRAASGTVLYLVLVALLTLGVAAAVRETAASVSLVLGLLLVAPALVALVGEPRWHERLERLTPMTAGLAVQATARLDQLPIGPWAGLGVLAAWSAASLLAGGVTLARRDVA
ncbi:ABC transporter permease subunit [Streptomyces sp. 4N509B]|uniref:ABC transporter permease subunit n=1 Tax=Streptomyces sp. 4N509B TaxID=3457413 RepID=UPI003FD46889